MTWRTLPQPDNQNNDSFPSRSADLKITYTEHTHMHTCNLYNLSIDIYICYSHEFLVCILSENNSIKISTMWKFAINNKWKSPLKSPLKSLLKYSQKSPRFWKRLPGKWIEKKRFSVHFIDVIETRLHPVIITREQTLK